MVHLLGASDPKIIITKIFYFPSVSSFLFFLSPFLPPSFLLYFLSHSLPKVTTFDLTAKAFELWKRERAAGVKEEEGGGSLSIAMSLPFPPSVSGTHSSK